MLDCKLQDKTSRSPTRDVEEVVQDTQMDNPIVEEVVQAMQMDNPITSNSATSQSQLASQSFGVDSPSSAHTSEYEDAELGTSHATLSYIMHHTNSTIYSTVQPFFFQHI